MNYDEELETARYTSTVKEQTAAGRALIDESLEAIHQREIGDALASKCLQDLTTYYMPDKDLYSWVESIHATWGFGPVLEGFCNSVQGHIASSQQHDGLTFPPRFTEAEVNEHLRRLGIEPEPQLS